MGYNKEIYLEVRDLVKKNLEGKEEVIVVCIGTDRSTGDSLGPFVGMFLQSSNLKMLSVYGTIQEPIHALNVKERMDEIKRRHSNALVIAVDAAMGDYESIGLINISEDPVRPGSAVGKKIEPIGDISVKVTMAELNRLSSIMLHNVRLKEVMDKAEEIREVLKMVDNYLNRKVYRKKFAEVAATRIKEKEKNTIFSKISRMLKKHPI